jgi:hypothetical protein
MKKNPKDPKILSKKKTNTMMLKTKWRKQKQRENVLTQHLGAR